jgi:hypothetical protein
MFRQSSSSNRTTIASLPNHALQKCQADSHRMVDGRTVTEPDLAIEVSISAHAPGCRPGGVAGGRLVPRYRTGLRAGASSGRPRIPRRSPFSGRAKYVEPGCVVWRELPAEVQRVARRRGSSPRRKLGVPASSRVPQAPLNDKCPISTPFLGRYGALVIHRRLRESSGPHRHGAPSRRSRHRASSAEGSPQLRQPLGNASRTRITSRPVYRVGGSLVAAFCSSASR